jgi:hypothetical protein
MSALSWVVPPLTPEHFVHLIHYTRICEVMHCTASGGESAGVVHASD